MPCPSCHDARWVCEAHMDRPWGMVGGCACGGAGAPCPACNQTDGGDVPEMAGDYRSLVGDQEVRPLPKPPRCRGIKVDEETYTGCAYGYGDVTPFTPPCDCPVCNGCGLESGYDPN